MLRRYTYANSALNGSDMIPESEGKYVKFTDLKHAFKAGYNAQWQHEKASYGFDLAFDPEYADEAFFVWLEQFTEAE